MKQAIDYQLQFLHFVCCGRRPSVKFIERLAYGLAYIYYVDSK